MHHPGSGRLALMMVWLCAPGLVGGCGAKDVAVPPPKTEAEARKSLEAALEAWKSGKTLDSFGEQTPQFTVVDSAWKAGQKIESYQIVKNQPSGDRARIFTVKLSFRQPRREREVRYLVSGTDEFWVCRDTDIAEALSPGNEASKPGHQAPVRRRSRP
jgi:hypothetical protein